MSPDFVNPGKEIVANLSSIKNYYAMAILELQADIA